MTTDGRESKFRVALAWLQSSFVAGDWLLLFLFLTTAFCGWVLSMPSFPSQDGPNHLFDAVIFGKLLAGSSSVYEGWYRVRYLLPPYSFHYYLLIALMRIVSPLMADKIVVCLVIVNFAFGFRYLAKGVGKSGGVLSLFVFTFVLNWPLAMGFENFCLALGFDLWALGLWVRFITKCGMARRAIFFLLCCVILLTHPVGLPLLIVCCTLDVCLRVVAAILEKSRCRSLIGMYWLDAATLLVCGCLILYIAAFTDRHRTAANLHAVYEGAWNLRTYAAMYGLAFFGKHGSANLLYRSMLGAVLLIAVTIGFSALRQRWKQAGWAAPESLFIITLLCAVLLPFVPNTVNDAYYFAVRLLVIVWIGGLAAASGHRLLPIHSERALAITATVFAAIILTLAFAHISPIATRIQAIDREPSLPPGEVGLYIPGFEGADYTFPVLYSLPYEWAGSHYFRANNAIMLNAPWMDSSYLPIGATARLLTQDVNFDVLQEPIEFRKELLRNKHLQGLVFPRIDFVFFTDPDHRANDNTLNEVLSLDVADHWSCHRNDWYVLCMREQGRR